MAVVTSAGQSYHRRLIDSRSDRDVLKRPGQVSNTNSLATAIDTVTAATADCIFVRKPDNKDGDMNYETG